MNREHARELWRIRFLKILDLEQESFNFYQRLLKEKSALLEEYGIKPLIQQIMRDEGRHIRIAKDLIYCLHLGNSIKKNRGSHKRRGLARPECLPAGDRPHRPHPPA